MWGFPSQQVRKDEVQCFAPFFSAGTSSCVYTAEVVTSGSFTLPPAHAKAVTQPGIMGLSAAGSFTVAGRSDTKPCVGALSKNCSSARRASVGDCLVCASSHNKSLMDAGCSVAAIDAFCSASALSSW